MTARPRALGTALVAAMIVLAGCGSQPGSPTAVTAQGLAAAPAAAPAVVDAAVAVRGEAGRVEIRVTGLAARKLLATTADISRIKVTLSGGPLTEPVVKEVTAAALAGGQGTVAFDAVPHGTVNVAIEVLDAAGEKIGEQAATATVARGETAVVAVALQLVETHVASENGNLALDLAVSDGEIVVDPIASPSPRPSTPVLSPAPSPTPTPTPGGVTLAGALERTWYADGTIRVRGEVKNGGAVATDVEVTITWRNKGLFGWKTAETRTVTVASVAAGSTAYFSATSTEKIANLFGQGTAEAAVTKP